MAFLCLVLNNTVHGTFCTTFYSVIKAYSSFTSYKFFLAQKCQNFFLLLYKEHFFGLKKREKTLTYYFFAKLKMTKRFYSQRWDKPSSYKRKKLSTSIKVLPKKLPYIRYFFRLFREIKLFGT